VEERDDLRVLVVEDDAAVRWLLRALVRKQGLACDAVEDGQQAVAALEMTPYALVLLDLVLPKVGVVSVLRRMDALSLATPVIVLSHGQVAQAESLSPRVKRIVPRPFEMDDLAAEVRLLCGLDAL
jgi:Response regulator containing CheY-like receiver, AAA-type ATPase, and DNA-binding domains